MSIALATVDQMGKCGVLEYAHDLQLEDKGVRGTIGMLAVVKLRDDKRFTEGCLHGYHADIGTPRTDFRSDRGSLGAGSLQLVVNLDSGVFWADVDKFNPYQDAFNWCGHAFVEVLPHWFKRKPKTEAERV